MGDDVLNKRVFFPIGTLAGPLLGGIASNLADPIIKKKNRWQTMKVT